MTDLYKANAILRPKRAVYQITKKGILLLKEYEDTLTRDVFQRQEEYITYMKELEISCKGPKRKI